jgi:voltage-gated potassium channel
MPDEVAEADPDQLQGSEPGNERLDAYIRRTQTPLDLIALCTLWLVVVPPRLLGSTGGIETVAWVFRVSVSVIYGIDMTIRTWLAFHRVRYLRQHVVGIVAVIFPPVRVLFSLRLVRMLFRRGNLDRFLLAAAVLLLNGALIVYFVERDAPGANIHTVGESIWWSIVTVTTVGYGDYFPVTVAGKVTAAFIMAIGIVTVAIITAQVASSFVDEAARRRSARTAGAASSAPVTAPVTLDDIDARLARIEQVVAALATPSATTGETDPPD